MRRNTSEHIGRTQTAWNTPRDDTLLVASMDQWTAGITHAHTLTAWAQSADGVVEDTGSVDNRVTATAISQSDDAGAQPLQVVRDTGIGSQLTPTGSQSSASGVDEGSSHTNGLSQVIECDYRSGLHQGNIVGESVGVVRSMVDDASRIVSDTTAVQQVSSNNDTGVGQSASNGAVSSR